MSSDVTPERVRPCAKCGALLAFRADRCPECGAALPPVQGHEERVECCMGCGVMVPFDTTDCPECGGAVRLPFDRDDERVKPCAHCGELVAYSDVHCVRCGNLTVEVEVPEIPPQVELVPAPTLAERAVDGGALLVLTAAGAALVTAVVLMLTGT